MTNIEKNQENLVMSAVNRKSGQVGNKIGPYIQFVSSNEKEGSLDIKFSDGTSLTKETYPKYLRALKNATGTDEQNYSIAILGHIARGIQGKDEWERMSYAAVMLPTLKPQDETEAMLAGQFLCLQETGMRYLRLASLQDGFYHLEKYTTLANKLFNTANQTMHVLLKYRTRGQQTMQVIHVHNEGQAIVAQNLSSSGSGEGGLRGKIEN